MTTWFRLLRGWFGPIGDNEAEIISTMPDPPKLRLGVVESEVETNLGAVSFNTVRRADPNDPDYNHDEYALVRGQQYGADGAIEFCTRDSSQEGVKQRLQLSRFGARFAVPISAPNLPAGQPKVTRFYTDGGRFCVNWQDDTGQPTGIVYDTHGTINETTWTPVGRVRIDPL